MKHFLSLVVLFVSTNALAASYTTFNCVTERVVEGKKPTQIRFNVSNLGKKSVSLDEESFEQGAFSTNPENSELHLNDNSSVKMTNDGIKITSDADGCQSTTLVLYKNTQYQHGYVSTKDTGCGRDLYSEVICK